jgi:hypothetical protein
MPTFPIRCFLFRDEMLYPSPECCSRRARWVGSGWPSDEQVLLLDLLVPGRRAACHEEEEAPGGLEEAEGRNRHRGDFCCCHRVTSTGANHPLEGVVVGRAAICVSSPEFVVVAAPATVLYARAGLEHPPWAARRGAAAGAGKRVGLPWTVNVRRC